MPTKKFLPVRSIVIFGGAIFIGLPVAHGATKKHERSCQSEFTELSSSSAATNDKTLLADRKFIPYGVKLEYPVASAVLGNWVYLQDFKTGDTLSSPARAVVVYGRYQQNPTGEPKYVISYYDDKAGKNVAAITPIANVHFVKRSTGGVEHRVAFPSFEEIERLIKILKTNGKEVTNHPERLDVSSVPDSQAVHASPEPAEVSIPQLLDKKHIRNVQDIGSPIAIGTLSPFAVVSDFHGKPLQGIKLSQTVHIYGEKNYHHPGSTSMVVRGYVISVIDGGGITQFGITPQYYLSGFALATTGHSKSNSSSKSSSSAANNDLTRNSSANVSSSRVALKTVKFPNLDNVEELNKPVAMAYLEHWSTLRDWKTGKELDLRTDGKTAVMVYGTKILPSYGGRSTQYVISLIGTNGKPLYVGTSDWNLKFFNTEDYLIDGKVVPWTELQARAAELEKIKKETERQQRIAEQEKRLKDAMPAQEQLRDKLKQSDATYLNDMIHSLWMQGLVEGPSKTVLILTGSEKSPDLAEALTAAKLAVERGDVVIFDADANSASKIAEVVGDRGVGITSIDAPDTTLLHNAQIISIENPYIRMKAFAAIKDRVMTSDSVTGWGLMFLRKMDYVIDTAQAGTISTIPKWMDSIDGSTLGLRYRFESTHLIDVTSAQKLDEKLGATKLNYSYDFDYGSHSGEAELLGTLFQKEGPVRFNQDQFIGKLETSTIMHMMDYQKSMMDGTTALDAAKSRGAVVFGSGSVESKYEKLVYGISQVIASEGHPVSTGGAFGFMRIANEAAFNIGAVSIGIPMTGIKGEADAATNVHTLTIRTNSYQVRIPLLLHKNDLIVVMPGGKGTLQEVAASFVAFASGLNGKQKLVFVSKDFYGGLVALIQSSSLPESIRSRIYLVNSTAEMKALLNN